MAHVECSDRSTILERMACGKPVKKVARGFMADIFIKLLNTSVAQTAVSPMEYVYTL